MRKKKNRYRVAAGLEYHSITTENIPSLNLKGAAYAADEIVRLAKRYGIPVIEDPPLAQALRALAIDQEIPESLFEAVAVVLYRLEKSFLLH